MSGQLRQRVRPEWIDYNGHLSEGYYVVVFGFATDAAMRVTTDAVQVLGGAGYTRDFPAERYLREAKVLQIFEMTDRKSVV